MSIYKRCFDKSKCMYFMIKDEKDFDKYIKISEKVSNIIKQKFNIGLIYNKKCLKDFITKESFYGFYIPVTLIDSVYRKDQNYYSKVFLEEFIHNFF